MRIVIALGGNALLKRGEPMSMQVQKANAHAAARSIARVVHGNELILTHGNGPQIGLLALQTGAGGAGAPYPLDLLGAETDGMIGYILEQELANVLGEGHVATLLTQIEVDPADVAFGRPTKFIGPQYDANESQRIAIANGWTMARDGAMWRRVVASPDPQRILEMRAIRLLVAAGFVTICAGGGGIPVARDTDGTYRGVECVVDKDLTSALLAEQLDAECLLMLTDVPAVYAQFNTPRAHEIRHASPSEIASFEFPAGSMGPKIEAACRFARQPHRRACIGNLADVEAILAGHAGTTITTPAS